MRFKCPAHFIIRIWITLTIFILKHRLRMLYTLNEGSTPFFWSTLRRRDHYRGFVSKERTRRGGRVGRPPSTVSADVSDMYGSSAWSGILRTFPSRAAPYFSFGVSALLIFENWISVRECKLLTEVQGDVRAWQTVFIVSAVMRIIVICTAVCHGLVHSAVVVIAIERTIFQLSGFALCWQL